MTLYYGFSTTDYIQYLAYILVPIDVGLYLTCFDVSFMYFK